MPQQPNTRMAPLKADDNVLAEALRLANAGRDGEAMQLCRQVPPRHANSAAALQLLAVLCLRNAQAGHAHRAIAASLALRPDHLPSLRIAVDAAKADGAPVQARRFLDELLALALDDWNAWFQRSVLAQDEGDLPAAAAALREVLRLRPQSAEAHVNLGIVLQQAGQADAAMAAYGHALRLREDTFGRVAHALAAEPCGSLWLSLEQLRADLLQASA